MLLAFGTLKYSDEPQFSQSCIHDEQYLVVSKAFNAKTRLHCCNLGTNYSSNGRSCKVFETPIADVSKEDQPACLSIVDFCCKKQFRLFQCNLGKEEARKGTCAKNEGVVKECCDACSLGIETKNGKDPCVDTIGLGSPYGEAFVSCCEDGEIAFGITTPTTTPKIQILPTSDFDSLPNLPGLSEENVCETDEYCAQLCEPVGSTFKCGCFDGYELMKDGVSCKPVKRAKGSRCEKNNPCDHDCIDTGTSIECSCRPGYELAQDNRSCKDIDECALGIHACKPDEECGNEEGTHFCYVNELLKEDVSFQGKCPTGLRFNADKSVCDDVDECEIELICPPPKVCRNSVGSFACEGPDCPSGFYFKASIESCADIDECITGDNDCNKDSQICLNTKGNYTCVDKASRKACPPGFKKNDTTYVCEDIDECQEDIELCQDHEICVNEDGGYKCVKVGPPGNKFGNVNQYTTPNVNPYSPLSCPPGYKFNFTQNTCDDINECQLRLDTCSVMHRCDNTIGSFYCTRTVSCGTGYTLNSADDLCEDDDECALGTHNCHELGPNYRCKNLMGSYRCEQVRPLFHPPVTQYTPPTPPSTTTKTSPPTTYSRTNVNHPSVTQPQPVTEIIPGPVKAYTTASRSNYPQYPRSYHNPNPFWQYQTTRQTYTTVETTTETTPSPTKARPTAPKPYPTQYVPYSTSPRTISNLYLPRSNPTPKYPIINGILKKCLPGYVMNNYGDCEDINECESNPCPKGLKCLNFNGRYECSSPLQCKIGYELNEAGDECIDVNECSRGSHKCNRSQICKNGQGYYTCECPPGHHLSRSTQMCEDIDECKFYRPCGNTADCINSIGSYECRCKSGFRNKNGLCDDINECLDSVGLCEHNCVNLWGSYRCACRLGFTLNYDNRTCNDIDECDKYKDRKLCIGTCKNIPGSYSCECPQGYRLGSDKRVCIDIDECHDNVCGPEDACVNTNGGYECFPITCPPNYVKDRDHRARCRKQPCDTRDYQCERMPEQYTYQYLALVSNLPLSEGGIRLFTIKSVDMAETAEFSIRLMEVEAPPNIQKVNESFFKKATPKYKYNTMELYLVRSIEGPQKVKLQVEMKLYQGNIVIGSVVVYMVIVVSEYPF
ncbi:fibulin-1-like [Cylas formicarius]|uniref:fibulin-1-like n=1 Tax=Cylas formicarius TaxID=197179 RepID=UPI0029583CC0|nr:fibulin-1-like [Cylas formicarius]